MEDPAFDAVHLMGTLNVLECPRRVGARKVYAAFGGTLYGGAEEVSGHRPWANMVERVPRAWKIQARGCARR
jgi:hypothetical protein